MLSIAILSLVIAVSASGRSGSVKGSVSPSAADVAKADYIYLEALRAKSQGDLDAAFYLLQRAHELNPADKETGLELSNYLISLGSDPSDTTGLKEGVALLRDYWDNNPFDYFTGVKYGLLAQRLLDRGEAVRVWGTLHDIYPEKTEISFQLADVLSKAGTQADRTRALAIYDSIEAIDGANPTLSGNKIQLFFNEKDTASILAETERLCKAQPSNADFAVFAGRVYAMFGQGDDALREFDRACELDPSNGMAYYSKAEYFNSIGDSTGFDREVFNALRQVSLDVDTKLSILNGYIRQMYADTLQQPRIRELFDTLIMSHPLEADIHESYARYLIVVQDYAGAAEQEEQNLGLHPDNLEGWEMLSSLYLQNEEFDRAEDAIIRSLHYFPDNARQHTVLAALYSQRKENDRCMSELDKAIELTDPADVEALSRIYTTMGDNYFQQDKPDSSYVCYRKAIAYNPVNTLALNNCAYHLAVEGMDLDDALRMIETVMKSENDNPTSLDTYAWVLFKRKDYARAREVIDRTLSLIPESEMSSDVLEHAGDIYFMDGEPDAALDFWKQALKLDPTSEMLKRKVKHKTYYYK